MSGFDILSVPAIAACAAAPLPGPAAAEWPEAVRDFSSPAEAIETAVLFPNSAGMQRRRLAAAIAIGDSGEALAALRRIAGMGAVPSRAELVKAEPLVGVRAIAQLAACFSANAEPLARSLHYATVPAEHRLVDGLLFDPERARLFATTAVSGRLAAVGDARSSSEPLGSLLGGAYDPARRLFWVASAALGMSPAGEAGFVGLVSVDPDDLSQVSRIPAPLGAAPADVAVARDGTVYASDGLSGAVYRCRPGCAALETWIAPGMLYSAQGLALSGDQRLLYVADRRFGLAAVDRASGRVFRVEAGPDVMLDGIDGLVPLHGDLIATQTAYQPQRIVRLRLSSDGLRVTRLDVLERANRAWGEVTLAVVAGYRLIYVADAQWERWGPGGVPAGARPAGPTPIRSLALH
ncbi:MAG TPA: hypothetical protein VGB79_09755 [Allosphingosinicella sp.]|jgi:hypothetical protein